VKIGPTDIYTHTLVAGFGNLYRQDDGVARFVVNALRERLGRGPLDEMDDGFDDLGHPVDTVVLHQLVPELADDLKNYELVIFVDAHVGSGIPEPIHEEILEVVYRAPFVYHQTHPSTVLALTMQMYGEAPRAVLLSLLGHTFDFGQGLSEETAALIDPAVDRILALARTPSRRGEAGRAEKAGHHA
jgi:hydrogenase maturation protease